MSRPAVQNASDRDQVKRSRQREKLRRDQEIADLKAVLSTAQGRRVLFRIYHHLRPNTVIFETGALLPYRAGYHDAGIFLMQEIEEASPDAFVEMLREHRDAKKRDELFEQPEKPREDRVEDED